jgi:hypothetical protein
MITPGNFHVHLTTGDSSRAQEKRPWGLFGFEGRAAIGGGFSAKWNFQALSKRLVSRKSVWRGPRAVAEVSRAVHTNLSPWDMVFLAVEARRLTSQRVNTVLLPGHPRGATWEMDVERTAFILDRLGNGGRSPCGRADSPEMVSTPRWGTRWKWTRRS